MIRIARRPRQGRRAFDATRARSPRILRSLHRREAKPVRASAAMHRTAVATSGCRSRRRRPTADLVHMQRCTLRRRAHRARPVIRTRRTIARCMRKVLLVRSAMRHMRFAWPAQARGSARPVIQRRSRPRAPGPATRAAPRVTAQPILPSRSLRVEDVTRTRRRLRRAVTRPARAAMMPIRGRSEGMQYARAVTRTRPRRSTRALRTAVRAATALTDRRARTGRLPVRPVMRDRRARAFTPWRHTARARRAIARIRRRARTERRARARATPIGETISPRRRSARGATCSVTEDRPRTASDVGGGAAPRSELTKQVC